MVSARLPILVAFFGLCGCAQLAGLDDDPYLVDKSDDSGAASTGGNQDASVGVAGSGAEAGSGTGGSAATEGSPGQGPWCGNSFCDWSEDSDTCPGDCEPYACGNHTCDAGEDVSSCVVDCGEPASCGNDTCEPTLGERDYNCTDDCPADAGGE